MYVCMYVGIDRQIWFPSVTAEAFVCLIGWNMPTCLILSPEFTPTYALGKGESTLFSNMHFLLLWSQLVPV